MNISRLKSFWISCMIGKTDIKQDFQQAGQLKVRRNTE